MFEAVSIEYAFGHLLGKRFGERDRAYDADAFRNGSLQNLGWLLELAMDAVQERIDRLRFAPEEWENGGARARLNASVQKGLQMAKELQKSDQSEPEDYHWEIVGMLVLMIGSLLDHLEGKGRPRAMSYPPPARPEYR